MNSIMKIQGEGGAAVPLTNILMYYEFHAMKSFFYLFIWYEQVISFLQVVQITVKKLNNDTKKKNTKRLAKRCESPAKDRNDLQI